MVVVVKSFAHCQEREPLEIGGTRVSVGTATEVMPEGVDRRVACEIDVRMNERGEKTSDGSDGDDENSGSDGESGLVMAEQCSIPSVAAYVSGVPVDDGRIGKCLAVQRDVLDLHTAPAEENR